MSNRRRVRKRNGKVVPYKRIKITKAIWSALQETGSGNFREAKLLARLVEEKLEEDFFEKSMIPKVEEIQDVVEKTLIEEDYTETARRYIRYRKSHEDLRNLRNLVKNVEMVTDYIEKDTWEVKENSNQSYSLQGMTNHIKGQVISEYWLSKIYPPRIKEAEESGDFHIHDLGILGPYCVGWSLRDLLDVGFKGAPKKIWSKPAKHFDTALLQVVNFLFTLQGEAAGAQAFSHFDTYLAPFIARDDLSFREVKQDMQKFLYNENIPTRTGFQAPFTNVTLDLEVPEFMEDEPLVHRGMDGVYGDYQEEMYLFNRAFSEVMMGGDSRGRPFSFPIPTVNITSDFPWDEERLDPLWEMTSKYGIPYFANFVNADMDPEDSRSMCCRLRLDKSELRKRGGGLFGSYSLTGSVGVVTINMPRIGYEADNEDEYFELLEERMNLAKESLVIKRKIVERLTEKGLYPYSKFYLRRIKERDGSYWANHFSTIGLNGMNESLWNFMDKTTGSQEGINFAEKVLVFMRKRLREFQKDTEAPWNLEATPAESTCYRLARKDRKKYPDLKFYNMEVAGGDVPYYTNSTQLPVGYTRDLFKEVRLQEPLQTKYTGGTVLHGFLGESLNDGMMSKKLVRRVMSKSRIPYFTITPTFSICPKHGRIDGEVEECPQCGQKTEVYSRVVGYLRPVSEWNKGKRQEFKEREEFEVLEDVASSAARS